MINRKTIQELKDKLDAIFQAYVRIEETIRDEISKTSWGKLSDSDASEVYLYLEYMLANISRQSFLTMTCSWLEVAIDVIGEAYIQDYMEKVKHAANGEKEGGWSWFDKRVIVFDEYCNAHTVIKEQHQFINHVLKVRNCIVHVGGRIEKDKYSDQVEKAVEWLWTKAKKGNENYANIRNGLIYLGDNIIAEIVIVSEDIIDDLWEHVATGDSDVWCDGIAPN